MRAGYTAIALAALGSIGLGTLVTSAIAPAPMTVRAALGLDGPDPPDLDRRRAWAVERTVAACLAREGFVYIPLPYPGPGIPDADLDPVAWAERWGFGVTTSSGLIQGAAPVDDPNLAFAGRLGPAEARRFRAALLGSDATNGGCRAVGAEAVHGLRQRLLAPLSVPLRALERRIAEDGRMAMVRAAWASCIGGAADAMGVPLADRTRHRLIPVVLDVLARRLAALAPGDRRALGALQAAERRSAVAVARCEATYAAEGAAIAEPYEAALVRTHRAALRRIGAAIRAAEAALPAIPARSSGMP